MIATPMSAVIEGRVAQRSALGVDADIRPTTALLLETRQHRQKRILGRRRQSLLTKA